MLVNILFFLPSMVCLTWTILLAFKQKNVTQRLLMEMLILCTVFFAAYATYISPDPDYHQLALLDAISMPIIFAILALNVIFVYSHVSHKVPHPLIHPFLFLPAISYVVISIFLNSQMGIEHSSQLHQAIDNNNGILPPSFDSSIDKLYNLLTIKIYRIIASIFLFLNLVTCFIVAVNQGYRWGEAIRFFFYGGRATTPIRAICFLEYLILLSLIPLDLFGRSFMHEQAGLSVSLTLLIAVSLHFLCYVEYFSELPEFSLKTLAHVSFGTPISEKEIEALMEETIEKGNTTKDDNNLVEKASKESTPISAPLIAQIKEAFEKKQVYRNPELSIKILAEQLGTNRTTLSLAINQMFGVPFRQLLNNYRVEAAKKFMIEHPDATQEVIAEECGYLTAQAFNSKFKEHVGVSPRAWLSKKS